MRAQVLDHQGNPLFSGGRILGGQLALHGRQ
jgi:hypothetical protein